MERIKTTITVDSEVWKDFLKLVIEKYGYDVGRSKKKALDEALRAWVKQNR